MNLHVAKEDDVGIVEAVVVVVEAAVVFGAAVEVAPAVADITAAAAQGFAPPTIVFKKRHTA